MSEGALPDPKFWRGKRVLLTGHTGFKGAWAALWLNRMGAELTGLALPAAATSLYCLANAPGGDAWICDLRDAGRVNSIVRAAEPEIIIHMAAQALVRPSIEQPAETMAINVGGTINLLEAARNLPAVRAILIVTSDKVYRNDGDRRRFSETDPLGGKDPYSASKAACEIVTASYRDTFFKPRHIPVATARAGNVIGGGDFSEYRIVPDCVRAAEAKRPLSLRHPDATRPWQHVLDCLAGYFLFVERLAAGKPFRQSLNFGPAGDSPITVGHLAAAIIQGLNANIEVRHEPIPGSIEAPSLSLDPTLARSELSWRERLPAEKAISETAAWYRAYLNRENVSRATNAALDNYLS
jgi:CDP-glucose 4,6-dehydratase